MRKYGSIVLIVMMLLLSANAAAATSVGGNLTDIDTETFDLFNIYDFKFKIFQNGIGNGNCPVYTAPTEKAFRGANGKASVDLRYRVDVAGFENGWILIRYEINSGYRVGYIERSYVKNFDTDMEYHFSHIPQQAMERIPLTDNPMDDYSRFAYLEPGDTYYILGKYTYYGNWWYIECEVDGKPARGFISRDTTVVDWGNGNVTNDPGDPERAPSGSYRIGHVVITRDNSIVRANAGQEYDMVARLGLADRYPVYGQKTGSNGNLWYYIYVDGVWGWISSGMCTFEN